MHNAPAVNYPVGRSRFQGWLVLGLGLGASVAGALWLRQIDAVGWRQWLFAAVLLVASGTTVLAWLRSARGNLSWDGKNWHWTGAAGSSQGVLTVHLDGQFFLLLSLRLDTGKRLWLWPERRLDVTRWSALRRAVFSRAAVVRDLGVRAAVPIANE
ncbi:MAG: hypothetical protein KJ614_04535 [Gammaproteobacteria bacterium]|uniref:hypothetical protein n=1 Tax=Rhodoferax sp. TaxID=50421 RepID=UPI0018018432|nr:hypothetical protein [Rhodoferax sp.]MBU3898187.1 hypothetical protein [Gammaproteobacteria bacterium]MBA3057889.1 hypothetical protein [Rhodoferax sp.]MBU3996493.1 hypothetical protein [Gammaproteobacteria bacterium]MBU4019002.1 hypothetical protein [Gammaproteobacteria bacterium]MBU4081622.1 hypothetical protein [Gammaproteobacteria bacterium]